MLVCGVSNFASAQGGPAPKAAKSVPKPEAKSAVPAAVGDFIGPGGRAEEGETEGVALGVVAIFGIVQEGEALLCIAEVSPAHGGNFELGFLPGVVARCGTFDGAVGNFIGGFGAGGGEREGSF